MSQAVEVVVLLLLLLVLMFVELLLCPCGWWAGQLPVAN